MMNKDYARKKLEDKGYSNIVEVSWPENRINHKHSHSWDAEIIIIDGSIRIVVGSKEHLLKSGDEFKLVAYVEHSEYVGDSGVTFLSVRPQTSN